MGMRWGCTLSIYADATVEAECRRVYQDDCNPLAEYLDTLSAEDNELWRDEATFALEYEREHWRESDVEASCERAIMERFAAEEAARSERAA